VGAAGLRVFVTMVVFTMMVCGAAAVESKTGVDRHAAKKVSDAFMADLVANRIDAAIARTTNAGQNSSDPEVLRWQYTRVLSLCGKPLGSKSLDEGVPVLGEDIQSGGNKRATLLFQYFCKTNHSVDQIFAVEVQMADDGRYQISGLSCHKPNSPGPAANK